MKRAKPPCTLKQKEMVNYLYRFRFLHTLHFQKLLNHKLPTRIQDWLKDLKDKGYIGTNYKRETFEQGNKPAIYFLKPKARSILENEEDFGIDVFNARIYKERKRGEKFVNHKLFVADMYLFFLEKKEKGEDIQFFTETDLIGYEYFPETELCAYIAAKTKRKTRRYFLNIFDPYTPAFVYRKRVKEYLAYAEEGGWKVNTNNEPLPLILFVCHSENMRKHTYNYAKAKLEKTFEDVSIFLTTQEAIRKPGDKNNIWQAVE
jgi:hypothetical protein